MSNLRVRIVRLEPLRVAYASGFGTSPEEQAWKTLLDWAGRKGLLADLKERRFFGFNNPDPSPGSPNYGYDQWMTVGPEVEPEGEIKLKEFPGGLYAVVRCPGLPDPEIWKQLVMWCEDSPYKHAHHQWLEECLTPPGTPWEKAVFDLYLPIVELPPGVGDAGPTNHTMGDDHEKQCEPAHGGRGRMRFNVFSKASMSMGLGK